MERSMEKSMKYGLVPPVPPVFEPDTVDSMEHPS